jgi:hypothetical protein
MSMSMLHVNVNAVCMIHAAYGVRAEHGHRHGHGHGHRHEHGLGF